MAKTVRRQNVKRKVAETGNGRNGRDSHAKVKLCMLVYEVLLILKVMAYGLVLLSLLLDASSSDTGCLSSASII